MDLGRKDLDSEDLVRDLEDLGCDDLVAEERLREDFNLQLFLSLLDKGLGESRFI